MGPADSNSIYSATYSGVPVFEFNVEGNHVMRRRGDHYINATHILKVADYDKPARTRILEREVQKGTHEKIQGGYGKYQGTWVPLQAGRSLAERNGVLEKLRPIFDYIPGDVSPPQAPKHTTNSNKPKAPKAPNVKKIPKPKVNPNYTQYSDDYDYDKFSTQLDEEDDQDNSTIATASYMEEDDGYRDHQYPNARKRKRGGPESMLDQEHTLYADNLLDYFVLSSSEEQTMHMKPPTPPARFDPDRPIDNQGHTALHWASAMGDIELVKFFMDCRATGMARNERGETPLIRAVLFTNNFEKQTMPDLVRKLADSLEARDNHGATVLHHIAMTTNSSSKKQCARYYLDIVLNKMAEKLPNPSDFARLINQQDVHGDTALHIVAKHNVKKCIRALQGRGVRGDIRNREGQTADQIIQGKRAIHHDFISSSPAPAEFGSVNGHEVIKAPKSGPATHYHSQSARSFSQSFSGITQDKGLQVALAFDSEVREKDDDLSEGQRLQQAAENERAQVRQATFKHFAEGGDSYDDDEVLRMREEERHLQAEGESLSEQIQHKELHSIVRGEEQRLANAERPPKDVVRKYNDAELEEQRIAALDLGGEQIKRRKLTGVLVEAQGAAGMSQHGEKLKNLVSLVCGVPIDEVPGLAPELLEELQESKIEVGNEIVGMA